MSSFRLTLFFAQSQRGLKNVQFFPVLKRSEASVLKRSQFSGFGVLRARTLAEAILIEGFGVLRAQTVAEAILIEGFEVQPQTLEAGLLPTSDSHNLKLLQTSDSLNLRLFEAQTPPKEDNTNLNL